VEQHFFIKADEEWAMMQDTTLGSTIRLGGNITTNKQFITSQEMVN